MAGAGISAANFRSVGQMTRALGHALWRLPADTGLVVPVPESGRLPAAFVALQTGRPVGELDRLITGGDAPEGQGGRTRILLVDDIAHTGGTLASARAALEAARPDLPVSTLAVYARAPAPPAADIVVETVAEPVLGEWSLFRSWAVGLTCFDMDGILCGDCPADADDDGERYRRFLETAMPLVVPRGRLRRIVTARLEKYRPETEAWLARHGIDYESLAMLDLPSEAERRRLKPQARFKAEMFREDPGAGLFVESESWQAREIAALAGGKPVFDYQGRVMLDRAQLAERGLSRRIARRLAGAASGLGRQAARRLGLSS